MSARQIDWAEYTTKWSWDDIVETAEDGPPIEDHRQILDLGGDPEGLIRWCRERAGSSQRVRSSHD